MSQLLKSLLTGFLILPMTIAALPSDNEQPLEIAADSTLINYKTGIHTYEGNVKITQGSSLLIADKLITKNNSNHKMEEAIAFGTKQLAEYSTIPRKGDKVLHAKAKIIRFYPPKSTIVLENDVIITQGENSFHGPMIIYNIKDQIINAPALKEGRATIIIDPNQLKS